jgi:hypothetical protein
VRQTFQEPARQLGLVSNRDQEAEICLQHAIDLNRPPSDIRFLLAQMVYLGQVENLWKRVSVVSWQMTETLRTLFVSKLISCSVLLICHLTTISNDQLSISSGPDSYLSLSTPEQHSVAFEIIEAVLHETCQLVFLQGSTRTGKTFTVRALISALQSRRKKWLICGTTCIAAIQYPGGTTVHSLFCLGINE